MTAQGPRATWLVEALPPRRAEDAVAVLCEAFHDYPVMRFVIGDAGGAYDRRLHALVGFFVAARFLRGEPGFVVADEGRAVATALLTPPGQRDPPPALLERREQVWRELGDDARRRYDALGTVWQRFAVAEDHYHLNMIGVRRSHAGRGLGRLLLKTVHDLSARDPDSAGVTLTTEDPRNVPLYEHFGYRVVGRATVEDAVETWGFFRPDVA